MNMILDASAAITSMLKNEVSQKLKSYMDQAGWIISPDLYPAEVSNALCKYHRFNQYPLSVCFEMLDHAIGLVDEYVPTTTLYKECFSLSCSISHPVYDVFYLVLARRQNATLVTLDKKLRALASDLSIRCLSL